MLIVDSLSCAREFQHIYTVTDNSYFHFFQELGNPTKFRVENSYGDKEYNKGYLLLTEPWFREFVFEVIVVYFILPTTIFY